MQEAIYQERLRKCARSREHEATQDRMVPGTKIEVFEKPTQKGIPGWKRGAVVLDNIKRTAASGSGSAVASAGSLRTTTELGRS